LALSSPPTLPPKPPVAIWGTKQTIHYARDHSVDDSLRQMGWIQGAIWSNANVREAVQAHKERRAGQFPDLQPLRSFRDA
jgi:enoyl-CoA hydratase